MELFAGLAFLGALGVLGCALADREKDNEGSKGRDYGGHVRVVREAQQ